MSERTFLEEISIRSIGVIEQATIGISKGLTVLTGETGAGKTMVLTALNLILGGKSDVTLVRKGSERAIASARFFIPHLQVAHFESNGLLIEDGELIITRTINSDGKSRATGNAISLTSGMLANVTADLVEVHAQAANLGIARSAKQRELLDKFAGCELEVLIASYLKNLAQYRSLNSRIAAFQKSQKGIEDELNALKDFSSAFSRLNLKRGEYIQICAAIERLSNIEELANAASISLQIIDAESSGTLATISSAIKALEHARNKDSELQAAYQEIREAFFLINSAKSSLASYADSLEADPSQLEFLNIRKSEILALVRKYGDTEDLELESDKLVTRFELAKQEIADLDGSGTHLMDLESELIEVKKDLVMHAKLITKMRTEAAVQLSEAVTAEIAQLSMPQTSMVIKIQTANYLALKASDFLPTGCDEVEMFISSHKDAPLVPLTRGASGGEMSRVMLALEVVIAANNPVGTYVFDEVDAGVGGKAAIEVGRRLFRLSRNAQVIVVTHLPQVAAWADMHLVVTKNINGSVSQSDVKTVTGAERIEEIARMLAGIESSLSAQEHATELLSMRLGEEHAKK